MTDIESANELMTLASMDGYLDGLDMKVAYCVTNEQDGGAVMETPVGRGGSPYMVRKRPVFSTQKP